MPQFKANPANHKRVMPGISAGFAAVLALSSAAGAIDAVAYFELGGVFVANMTGNTVLAAGLAVLGKWPDACRHFGPVLTFLLGVTCARVAIARFVVPSKDHPSDPRIAICLTGSAVLVLLCAPFAGFLHHALPALLAFGVGAQNAVLTRLGSATFNTAFITGDLEKLAESVVQVGTHDAGSDQPRRQARISAAIWLSYFVAAAIGTAASRLLHAGAFLLPALLLFGAAGLLRRKAAEDTVRAADGPSEH